MRGVKFSIQIANEKNERRRRKEGRKTKACHWQKLTWCRSSQAQKDDSNDVGQHDDLSAAARICPSSALLCSELSPVESVVPLLT